MAIETRRGHENLRHGRRRKLPRASASDACRGATLPSVEERYESELARSATVLDGVERTLDRLDQGTYGQCETCGASVLEADLERDPTRRFCERHLIVE
jgi:RNA polymerase-binding transcription factor DksA